MRSSTLLPLAALTGLSAATYTLQTDYGTGDDFFDKFTFYTETDPTAGYVTYVDQSTASSAGLIKTEDNATYIGVDHTNVASGSGRQSVRLTSTATYSSGLFILDLAHMPGGTCGTWPAFWTSNIASWPADGEIDIIEGVNSATQNQMTLHTGTSCTIESSGFAGTLISDDCDAYDNGNAGCAIQAKSTNSYGAGFDANGEGGVYAMEWTDSAISVYWWLADNVPSDITDGAPDPSGWGTPPAKFVPSCSIADNFADHSIIFDITFCGDWAGADWSDYSACSAQASTCDSFVQDNPSAFVDTYWLVNSLKVYQQ